MSTINASASGQFRIGDITINRLGFGAKVALAWLLQHSPVMLPIPGTLRVAHLEENVAAASLSLTPEEIAELDAAA
jgi:aryl-alcohol dehydrogenase-like predicted oxidoreductase